MGENSVVEGMDELMNGFMDRIDGLCGQERDEALWETLTALEGCVFTTAKGLEFTFSIRGGEMFVSRKEKSLTEATVFMAFHRALELGADATGPKKLGTFGASYLYPVFVRLGVCGVRKKFIPPVGY